MARYKEIAMANSSENSVYQSAEEGPDNPRESDPSPKKTAKESKKRKDDFEDDFFNVGSFTKKDKKKHKKTRRPKREESPAVNDLLLQSDKIFLRSTSTVEDLTQTQSSEAHDTVPQARVGTITPPPVIDKEAYVRGKLDPSEVSQRLLLLEDDEDDADDAFFALHSVHKNPLERPTSSEGTDEYQFDDHTEKRRPYILNVTSKIPYETPADMSVDFGTKGTKKFDRIIESMAAHFRKIVAQDPDTQAQYDPAQVGLIWVEGQTELKPFFRPSTLRIQPSIPASLMHDASMAIPATKLTCLLIPRQLVGDFLDVYPSYFKTAGAYATDLATEIEHIDDVEEVIESEEDDFVTDAQPAAEEPILVDEYFPIGLKGRDNKRIEVQVSSTTPIRKLLDYYVSVKGIAAPAPGAAHLIFDDEPLDMDGVVGDTELEEGFEVQVVV